MIQMYCSQIQVTFHELISKRQKQKRLGRAEKSSSYPIGITIVLTPRTFSVMFVFVSMLFPPSTEFNIV